MTPAHSPELVYMGVTFLHLEICWEVELERWCRLLLTTFGVWEEGS